MDRQRPRAAASMARIMALASMASGGMGAAQPISIDCGNGEYHPRKHTKQSYAAQNRAAKKRRRAK